MSEYCAGCKERQDEIDRLEADLQRYRTAVHEVLGNGADEEIWPSGKLDTEALTDLCYLRDATNTPNPCGMSSGSSAQTQEFVSSEADPEEEIPFRCPECGSVSWRDATVEESESYDEERVCRDCGTLTGPCGFCGYPWASDSECPVCEAENAEPVTRAEFEQLQREVSALRGEVQPAINAHVGVVYGPIDGGVILTGRRKGVKQ